MKEDMDARGDWRITPPTLYDAAALTVGKVPKLNPHSIILGKGIFNHNKIVYKSAHTDY